MQDPIVVVQAQEDWLSIENVVQHAVVQIVAQVGKFNWKEPYKNIEQHESRGTGFFVDDQGHIVTNAHVINEAKVVWIHLPAMGKKVIRVKIISFCPDRDLGLLKVVDEDLSLIQQELGAIPFLSCGNSDQVRRTDKILSLGYPLGQYRLKSSTGIISGRESGSGISYLQMTAAVNPGSSGGPLLSVNGEVVGITVASIANASHIGYAIPVNEFTCIVQDMMKKKLFRKPIIGGMFHETTQEHAKFLGNPIPTGVYIYDVLPDSLLEQAGVKQADVLYSFNGVSIDPYGEARVDWSVEKVSLYDLISRLYIGQAVDLELYRNGEKITASFILKEPVLYPVRMRYPDYEIIDYEVIGGMVVMELSDNHFAYLLEVAPELITYSKIENRLKSVLIVTHILPGSCVQQLRSLSAGDILKEVNGIAVSTLDDFRKMLRISLDSDFLTIKTVRNIFAVLPFRQILKKEEQLSKDFVYTISETVQELLELIIHEKTS